MEIVSGADKSYIHGCEQDTCLCNTLLVHHASCASHFLCILREAEDPETQTQKPRIHSCAAREGESPKCSILNTDFVHLQLEKERAAQAKAAGEAAKEGDIDLLSFDDEDLALATFDALIDDVSAWFGIWGTVLI